jgi:hypothetical protein
LVAEPRRDKQDQQARQAPPCGGDHSITIEMLRPIPYCRLAPGRYLRGIPFIPHILQRLSVLLFYCYLPYTADIRHGLRLNIMVWMWSFTTRQNWRQLVHHPWRQYRRPKSITIRVKALGDITLGTGRSLALVPLSSTRSERGALPLAYRRVLAKKILISAIT